MRTRKPCVLFRLRLLGWKVRFIAVVPRPKGPDPRWAPLPWAKSQVYTGLAFPVNRPPRRARQERCLDYRRVIPLPGLTRDARRPFQALETAAFPQVLKSLCKKGFVGRLSARPALAYL